MKRSALGPSALVVALLVSAPWAIGAVAHPPRALVAGTLVDGTGATPVKNSVLLIRDGKIACAGPRAACPIPPGVEVMDVSGMWVTPGLVDAHVHALGAGLSEFRGALPPLDSFAAVQDFIRKQAARTPKGQWIVVPRTFPTRLKELRMLLLTRYLI